MAGAYAKAGSHVEPTLIATTAPDIGAGRGTITRGDRDCAVRVTGYQYTNEEGRATIQSADVHT